MARALSKEILLKNRQFTQSATLLYRNINHDEVAERYSKLTEGLTLPLTFFSSPGRVELIGNHTDHNRGLVIAASVDMDVVGAVMKRDDGKITVESAGYPAFTVDISELSINEDYFGTSVALLKGVVAGFLNRGYRVGGFHARTQSNIFKGAGVSSSAAFELLLCEILNVFYNDGALDAAEKALIGQYAENVYFGKPSGLMDQLTIARGGVSFMDFKEELPAARSLPFPFDGLKLAVINCGGDHCNLTGEYAAIRKEMNDIAGHFGKTVLREVESDDFFAALPALSKRFHGRAVLRAGHFFLENQRVLSAEQAFVRNHQADFLAMLTESGRSSYMLLQNCYPASDIEQRVPLALFLAANHAKTLACRVHGGGFQGTVLAVVAQKDGEVYRSEMEELFGKENVFLVGIRTQGAIKVEEFLC